MSEDEKREIVFKWLELIDRRLQAQEVPISSRSLPAADMFVSQAICSFYTDEGERSDSRELRQNFLLSKSFREFYELILEWYSERYGAAFTTREDWDIKGAVSFAGDFFEFLVPVVFMERVEDPNKGFMHFHLGVHAQENPLDWITRAPDFKTFDQPERETLEEQAIEIARNLRIVRLELMSTDHPTKLSDELRTAIPSHIETAADHLINGRNRNLAIWEIYFATEKMLKLLIAQRGKTPPKTHNLQALLELLMDADNTVEIDLAPSQLPSPERAIELRYDEGEDVGGARAFAVYRATLNTLAMASSHLKTEHRIAGRVSEIKKPDFFPE